MTLGVSDGLDNFDPFGDDLSSEYGGEISFGGELEEEEDEE